MRSDGNQIAAPLISYFPMYLINKELPKTMFRRDILESSAPEDPFVQHDYHDFANERPSPHQALVQEIPTEAAPFPHKVHKMLSDVDTSGLSHIVSWQPHGRCFSVHNPAEFTSQILPRYFPSMAKLASFQRQLTMYGFQRITQGPDRGSYYNQFFLRDRLFLTSNIQRIRIKGNGVRDKPNPEAEPNFYVMPFVQPLSAIMAMSGSASAGGVLVPPQQANVASSSIDTSMRSCTSGSMLLPPQQQFSNDCIISNLGSNMATNFNNVPSAFPSQLEETKAHEESSLSFLSSHHPRRGSTEPTTSFPRQQQNPNWRNVPQDSQVIQWGRSFYELNDDSLSQFQKMDKKDSPK